MNPVTDHPLSLPQTTLSMAVAHKSEGSFHLGKVTDLFITSLRHPLEPSLMLHNLMLRIASVHGHWTVVFVASNRWQVALADKKVARTCSRKHALCVNGLLNTINCVESHFRQWPVLLLKFSHITNHLSVCIHPINIAHTRFEHPWHLPFCWNVMDGLNVTYALGVSVCFCMGVVVYALTLFVSVRC